MKDSTPLTRLDSTALDIYPPRCLLARPSPGSPVPCTLPSADVQDFTELVVRHSYDSQLFPEGSAAAISTSADASSTATTSATFTSADTSSSAFSSAHAERHAPPAITPAQTAPGTGYRVHRPPMGPPATATGPPATPTGPLAPPTPQPAAPLPAPVRAAAPPTPAPAVPLHPVPAAPPKTPAAPPKTPAAPLITPAAPLKTPAAPPTPAVAAQAVAAAEAVPALAASYKRFERIDYDALLDSDASDSDNEPPLAKARRSSKSTGGEGVDGEGGSGNGMPVTQGGQGTGHRVPPGEPAPEPPAHGARRKKKKKRAKAAGGAADAHPHPPDAPHAAPSSSMPPLQRLARLVELEVAGAFDEEAAETAIEDYSEDKSQPAEALQTALVGAISHGAENMVRLLWDHCQVNEDEDLFARYKVQGRYLADRAVLGGHPELLPVLFALGAPPTERALAHLAADPALLMKWLDSEDAPEDVWDGSVSCEWANTYHDLCDCCDCSSREMPNMMKTLGTYAKAVSCDDSYNAVIRQLFAAALQRWHERPERPPRLPPGAAHAVRVITCGQLRVLTRLVDVCGPWLGKKLGEQLAMLCVRADCDLALRHLANTLGAGANRVQAPREGFLALLTDAGKRYLQQLAAKEGALHVAALLRRPAVVRLLLQAVPSADFMPWPIGLGEVSSSAFRVHGARCTVQCAGPVGPEVGSSTSLGSKVVGSEVVAVDLKGSYALTPLLCAVVGPASSFRGVEGATEPLLAIPPAKTAVVLEVLSVLLERHANVDVDITQDGSEGAGSAAAAGGSTQPIKWPTLLLRPQQELAREISDVLLKHSLLGSGEAVRTRLRCLDDEAKLQRILEEASPKVEAIKDWCAALSVPTFNWHVVRSKTLALLEALVGEGTGYRVQGERGGGAASGEASSSSSGAAGEQGAGYRGHAALEALIEHAALPTDLRFANGMTILLKAAAADRVHTVRMLLERCVQMQGTGHRTFALERTSRKDTVLHVAVTENAYETVALLLRFAEGRACLGERNAAGQLPADCVDRSKKSASAATAKRIRQLLHEATEKERAARERAAAVESRPSSAKSDVQSPPAESSGVAAAGDAMSHDRGLQGTGYRGQDARAEPLKETQPQQKPPPAAHASPSAILHARIVNDSSAATRRVLEANLAKALASQLSSDTPGSESALSAAVALTPAPAPTPRASAAARADRGAVPEPEGPPAKLGTSPAVSPPSAHPKLAVAPQGAGSSQRRQALVHFDRLFENFPWR